MHMMHMHRPTHPLGKCIDAPAMSNKTAINHLHSACSPCHDGHMQGGAAKEVRLVRLTCTTQTHTQHADVSSMLVCLVSLS